MARRHCGRRNLNALDTTGKPMCSIGNTQPLRFGFGAQDRAHKFAAGIFRVTTKAFCALNCFLRCIPSFAVCSLRLTLLPVLVFLVSACATPVTHYTPSGKPEVTISSTDGDLIKSLVISEMLNRGYSVSSEREYSISFDKSVDNVLAASLLGSQYNSTPNARITYTIIRTQNALSRVVAALQFVTNPGSPHERYTDASGNRDSVEIQALLYRVREKVETNVTDGT